MTTGSFLSGENHPYKNGVFREWTGSDDPEHKHWNPYSMRAFTRFVYVAPGKYAMGSGTDLVSEFTPDDDLRLLDKLSSKVKQHDFNAGVFLGTSHQLVGQTLTAIRGVSRVVRLLKRGDLTGAIRSLPASIGARDVRSARRHLDHGDIAGAHLAMVYGWLPTYHDLYAAASAWEKLNNPERKTKVVATRTVKSNVECSQSPTLYSCPGSKLSQKRIELEIIEDLTTSRSLGLRDPLSVVWELTPWSFVADWFLPIGTYLSVMGTIPHLKGTYRISEKTSVSAPSCTSKGNTTYFDGCRTLYREVTFKRLAETSAVDIPLPRFRGFDQLYHNGQRIANATALLAQFIKGSRRYD